MLAPSCITSAACANSVILSSCRNTIFFNQPAYFVRNVFWKVLIEKFINRLFSRSGHMVQNYLCWGASCTVGLPNKGKLSWTGTSFFVLYATSSPGPSPRRFSKWRIDGRRPWARLVSRGTKSPKILEIFITWHFEEAKTKWRRRGSKTPVHAISDSAYPRHLELFSNKVKREKHNVTKLG